MPKTGGGICQTQRRSKSFLYDDGEEVDSGSKVLNRERQDLGTIEDLVIDTRDSRIAYAILSFGGFLQMGDKHFAIPWAALAFNVAEKVAVLNVDKDRLNNAPGFDKDHWPDMADTAGAARFTATMATGRIGKTKRLADAGESANQLPRRSKALLRMRIDSLLS